MERTPAPVFIYLVTPNPEVGAVTPDAAIACQGNHPAHVAGERIMHIVSFFLETSMSLRLAMVIFIKKIMIYKSNTLNFTGKIYGERWVTRRPWEDLVPGLLRHPSRLAGRSVVFLEIGGCSRAGSGGRAIRGVNRATGSEPHSDITLGLLAELDPDLSHY